MRAVNPLFPDEGNGGGVVLTAFLSVYNGAVKLFPAEVRSMFKVGDAVRLNWQSPVMTVVQIGEAGQVACTWHSQDGLLQQSAFPAAALKRALPDGAFSSLQELQSARQA
jgi:uncharacterized protein YodC (DUF2158 family)